MMAKADPFGDRMKSYEKPYLQHTVPRVPMVIRVDGCHFHSFTKGMAKPFDEVLMESMRGTMAELCASIPGAIFGYTQSDEISIVCRLADMVDGCEYYEGRVQKIISVTASRTTAIFNRLFASNAERYMGADDADPSLSRTYGNRLYRAEFDARVMSIPDWDLYNYLIWRQSDASRNSISMLAQSMFLSKELNGKNRSQMMDMMMSEGVNWNDLDTCQKRGACCARWGAPRPKWHMDMDMPILSSDEGRRRYQSLVEGIGFDDTYAVSVAERFSCV